MELQYRTRNGRLALKAEGESQKDLFKLLAMMQEVFDTEERCGVCQSSEVRFQVRTVDNFEHYELACCKSDCGARFEFGQHKGGQTLFPKRRDDDGKPLPNRGWKVWKTA